VNGDGTVYSAKDGAAVYLGSMKLAGLFLTSPRPGSGIDAAFLRRRLAVARIARGDIDHRLCPLV
jgi:hypothetical protein